MLLFVANEGTAARAYFGNHIVKKEDMEKWMKENGFDPWEDRDQMFSYAFDEDLEAFGGIRFTERDIMEALMENCSYEDGKYYLHMTDDQEIVPSFDYSSDTHTFFTKRDESDLEDDDDIQDIYDTEGEDNEFFMSCVEDLYDQAVEFFVETWDKNKVPVPVLMADGSIRMLSKLDVCSDLMFWKTDEITITESGKISFSYPGMAEEEDVRLLMGRVETCRYVLTERMKDIFEGE